MVSHALRDRLADERLNTLRTRTASEWTKYLREKTAFAYAEAVNHPTFAMVEHPGLGVAIEVWRFLIAKECFGEPTHPKILKNERIKDLGTPCAACINGGWYYNLAAYRLEMGVRNLVIYEGETGKEYSDEASEILWTRAGEVIIGNAPQGVYDPSANCLLYPESRYVRVLGNGIFTDTAADNVLNDTPYLPVRPMILKP